MRYLLAALLDRWEQRLRRLAEKWGLPQAWFQEFQQFLGQPRMTMEEMWVRYTLLRMKAEETLKPVMSEAECQAFYQTNSYFLWRNLVHRRHVAWRRVLATMPRGEHGSLLEFGCGIAPVSRYCAPRRKDWVYYLVDLPSPHRDYAVWRVRQHAFAFDDWPVPPVRMDVVTALDTFEHLADPVTAARDCVMALRHGGFIHFNCHWNPTQNDLDLATAEQLLDTETYLESVTEIVWRRGEYRIGRKK